MTGKAWGPGSDTMHKILILSRAQDNLSRKWVVAGFHEDGSKWLVERFRSKQDARLYIQYIKHKLLKDGTVITSKEQ